MLEQITRSGWQVWCKTLPVAPCPAASGGLLCFVGDVLGWLGQFLLGLALLLPDAWPAPPGCLPCTTWMLGMLFFASDLILLCDHLDWYYFGGVQE
jgi:hypothetical protein